MCGHILSCHLGAVVICCSQIFFFFFFRSWTELLKLNLHYRKQITVRYFSAGPFSLAYRGESSRITLTPRRRREERRREEKRDRESWHTTEENLRAASFVPLLYLLCSSWFRQYVCHWLLTESKNSFLQFLTTYSALVQYLQTCIGTNP